MRKKFRAEAQRLGRSLMKHQLRAVNVPCATGKISPRFRPPLERPFVAEFSHQSVRRLIADAVHLGHRANRKKTIARLQVAVPQAREESLLHLLNLACAFGGH